MIDTQIIFQTGLSIYLSIGLVAAMVVGYKFKRLHHKYHNAENTLDDDENSIVSQLQTCPQEALGVVVFFITVSAIFIWPILFRFEITRKKKKEK